MKKYIACFVAAAAIACMGASPAATQEWVRNYVATNSAFAAGSPSYTKSVDAAGNLRIVGTDAKGNTVTVTGQMNDKLAIVVTNLSVAALNLGFREGMKLAWDGVGGFVRGNGSLYIQATPTNIVVNGIKSIVEDGVDVVPGMFRVYGTRVTLAEYTAIMNGTASLVDAILGLFCMSARADTWQQRGEMWWKPQQYSSNSPKKWSVVDNSGNMSQIVWTQDADGSWHSNAEEVIQDLSVNVKTLFRDVATLADGMVETIVRLDETDQQFRVLQENLDAFAAAIDARFHNIEVNDKEYTLVENTYNTTQQTTVNNKSVYIGSPSLTPDGKSLEMEDEKKGTTAIKGWKNGAACNESMFDILTASDDATRLSHKFLTWFGGELHYLTMKQALSDFIPDDKSTESGENNTIKIKGFDGNAGKILYSTGDGVSWTTLPVSATNVVHFDGADDKRFYSGGMGVLANFDAPDTWAGAGIVAEGIGGEYSAFCVEGLQSATDGNIPYAKNGSIEWRMPASGNFAITGTDGVRVEGTNVVFASADDSAVEIKATSNNGTITVKIGVYYK